MTYNVVVVDEAKEDIAALKKSEIKAYEKVQGFFNELKEHPKTGTGKPEMMKHGKYRGMWSRRINKKHRLVYSINDAEIVVIILTAKEHYDDK